MCRVHVLIGGGLAVLLLSTPALAAGLVASPTSLSFGNQRVGTTSAGQEVTLSNTNVLEGITITSITPPASFLSSGITVPATVDAGSSVRLTVFFSPTASGAASGTLVIQTDSADTPTVEVSLSGNGSLELPALVGNPSALSFGNQRVGTTSASQAVTLSNTGSSTLVIESLSVESDFSVVGPTTPFTLAPDAGQALSVAFTPGDAGSISRLLRVTSNDPAVSTLTISLSGTGVQPSAEIHPDSFLLFSSRVGTQQPWSFILHNAGGSPLFVSAVILEDFDQVFSLEPITQPFTVDAGSSQELKGTFHPQVEVDWIHEASVIILSDDPDEPRLEVTLWGWAYSSGLEVSPFALEFGSQLASYPSSPRTLLIRNRSGGTINILNREIKGEGAAQFRLVAPPSMPYELKEEPRPDSPDAGSPDAGLPLQVSFTPSASAEAVAELVLTTDDVDAPEVRVRLRGVGIPSVLAISPTQLNLGLVNTQGSAVGQFVLTNVSSERVLVAPPEIFSEHRLQFSTIPSDEFPLEPGQSATVQVRYTATVAAAVQATLIFATREPLLPQAAQAGVSVTVVSNQLEIAPAEVDFGRVEVGAQSAPQEIRVTNHFTTARALDTAKVRSTHQDFLLLNPEALAAPIPAGGTASLQVAFQPTAAGLAEGELALPLVGDSALASTLKLKGTGRNLGAEGGGQSCSSASGGVAALGLLALLVLRWRRRR